MDIKEGDKVRFNQKGLDTPDSDEGQNGWFGIGSENVAKAKIPGTGAVTKISRTNTRVFLHIDFQDMPSFAWPVEMFEKEEEKLEFTQEEKELLRELVQDKLKGYQGLLDKLQ